MNRRIVFGLSLVFAAATVVFAQAAQRGRGPQPRQRKAVLAWADTRNGIAQHDSVSHASR